MARAQITLFVVIAILIITVIGTISLLGRNIKEPFTSDLELNNLKRIIASCVKSEGESALYLIGAQGGYVDVPLSSVETNYTMVAYAFYENRDVFISKKEIENQINTYMERSMPLCVNFSLFKNLNITRGEIESRVFIYPESVVIELKYPITVKKAGTVYLLTDWQSQKFKVGLGLIYDTVKNIVKNQLNNQYIDLSFMLNQKIPIYLVNMNNKKYVYALHDTESELKNQTYMFMFAFKY